MKANKSIMKKKLKNNPPISKLVILASILALLALGFYIGRSYDNRRYIVEYPANHNPEKLVNYLGSEKGITIKQKADVAKLSGASDSFKRFIADDLEIYNNDFRDPQCDDFNIYVIKIYNDEFALGGVSQCDNTTDHVWKKENSNWSKIIAGDVAADSWPCTAVNLYKVPNILIDKCRKDNSGWVMNLN